MSKGTVIFFPLRPEVLSEEFREPVEGDSVLSAAVIEVCMRSAGDYKQLLVAAIGVVPHDVVIGVAPEIERVRLLKRIVCNF